MKRREVRKRDTIVRAAKRTAVAFSAFALLTASVPGCKKTEENEKTEQQLKQEGERKQEFSRLLGEKLGHNPDVYRISYPITFDDMLDSPFDKEDAITYEFVFDNVNPKEVHEVLSGLKEAFDGYYLERKLPLIKDDKNFETWFVTDFYSVNYERGLRSREGKLEVSVQFEKMEEEIPSKKKRKEK